MAVQVPLPEGPAARPPAQRTQPIVIALDRASAHPRLSFLDPLSRSAIALRQANPRMLHTSSAKSHPEQQPIVTFAARAKQAAKPGRYSSRRLLFTW